MNKHFAISFLSLFVITLSCTKEEFEVNDVSENQYLVESKHHYLFTGRILGAIAKGYSTTVQKFNFNNVNATKITYRTKSVNNTNIHASGIILLPETKGSLPILSYQHRGDLDQKTKAPSLTIIGSNELTLAAMIASTGYIVLVADYIGYGDSKQEEHPFEHKASLAQSGLDFIEATKEYFKENGIKNDSKISLAGYLEGAPITLAMHQLMERKEDISIDKCIAGEGLLLKKKWVENVLNNNQNEKELTYLLKLIQSYKTIYPKLSFGWNHYLKEDYAENIEMGTPIDSIELNMVLPESVFNSNFSDGILSGEDTDFIYALKQNEISPWETNTPIVLFYNDKGPSHLLDQAKSFQNSFNVYQTSIKLRLNKKCSDENPILPFAIQVIEELHDVQ